MRANEVKLLDFIKKSPQLIVPIYQRNYSWERKECQQLWNDIVKAGSDNDIRGHFIGSIVYTQEQDFQVSDNDPLLVIDGQQRLTSVMLIIAGLVELLDDETHSEWFNAKRFQDFYLFNPHESGEMRYKLLLSKTDKQTLAAIVSQKDIPSSYSKKIIENYRFFKELIIRHQDDKQTIFKGLRKLVVVDIALNRNQDNPQLIFESMNSKGRPLCQADLIRNYVLMGLYPETQKRLYEELWYPMEEEFGQEYYNKHLDKFMRYYLTLKERTIPKESEVYSSFKEFVVNNGYDIEEVIKEIRKFSSHYCKIVLNKESDPELQTVFNDLNELKVTAVYPFLLEIYDYYFDNILPKDHLIEIVRFVESYIFRRSVCSISTKTINKIFAKLTKDIPNDRKSIQYIKASILSLRSAERFPTDKEFSEALRISDMYNINIRKYWLIRLENFDRKERVLNRDVTIEHIMPQSEVLSRHWIRDLGSDWKRIHQEYLHRIGNLTLTGYNSEYSNKPFQEKRDMKGGFRESPLRLNAGLGLVSNWNETEIKNRTERLIDKAIKVWPLPYVPGKILEDFNETVKSNQGYSINDHPKLTSSHLRPLFVELRKKVLELDPLINEEYQKLYVTYKLYNNVFALIPLSNQLKLILNTSVTKLHDPQNMCRDVSNIGRWGNGEVEVKLSHFEDVPYVISLISQIVNQQTEEFTA